MRTYYTNRKGQEKIKIGVEYHAGDSGGYYTVFDEAFGEQVEVRVAYPIAQLLFEYQRKEKDRGT